MIPEPQYAAELRDLVKHPRGPILADPPWRFSNRTGEMAPEHRRLRRYDTMHPEVQVALRSRQLVNRERLRVGFYFRNVTELVLFGVRGSPAPRRPVEDRSISWRITSGSTPASRMSFTRSSRLAAWVQISNSLRGIADADGSSGATR